MALKEGKRGNEAAGAPDEKWGERVQAAVVLKPDQSATQEELIATFNDITDQTVVESDDTVEILPQTISEVNPDEPFD